MRFSSLLSWLAISNGVAATHLPPRNYKIHSYYAVHLDSSVHPSDFARHVGLEYEGPLGSLEDHHLFRAVKHDNDVIGTALADLQNRRRKRETGAFEPHLLDAVKFNQKQVVRSPMQKRQDFDDDFTSTTAAATTTTRSSSARITTTSTRTTTTRTRLAASTPTTGVYAQQIAVKSALGISDPLFDYQWHLLNTAYPGDDLNVTGLWQQGITGNGTTVAIVDDGLDMDSEDLKDNYFAKGSYDFNDHTESPKPKLDDDYHGTRCAGEIGAGKNRACGLGVAYNAKISGVRILSEAITSADEALAIGYAMQDNDIYSCSWGPPDDGMTMQGPDTIVKRAILNAVQKGRDGKGSIYVFAAGNGGRVQDDCNFDGFTNSIYSVTVGGLSPNNVRPTYSESCSALLVVTYSQGGSGTSASGIVTTDVGASECSTSHGGTSAAGPLAAGVYALALSVRPDLTWRDIQWLTVMTAVPFDSSTGSDDWQTTALERKFSHQFGYGKLDAGALVEAAKTWKNVKPQAWYWSNPVAVNEAVPEDRNGISKTISVTKEDLEKANLQRIEQITVVMNVRHTRRGDLSVELRSPSGVISRLATGRPGDAATTGFRDWGFMSVAHWGESGVGDWTVTVRDNRTENGHTGEFSSWQLQLWGESMEATKQKDFPVAGNPTTNAEPGPKKSAAPQSSVMSYTLIGLSLLASFVLC